MALASCLLKNERLSQRVFNLADAPLLEGVDGCFAVAVQNVVVATQVLGKVTVAQLALSKRRVEVELPSSHTAVAHEKLRETVDVKLNFDVVVGVHTKEVFGRVLQHLKDGVKFIVTGCRIDSVIGLLNLVPFVFLQVELPTALADSSTLVPI